MAGKKEIEKKNRYSQLIESIFFAHYKKGLKEFTFQRDEIVLHASRLGIHLPKNLGDMLYSFRYRMDLPDAIRASAPAGMEWTILSAGRSKYRFVATANALRIIPNEAMTTIKVPDATPGIIAKYALNDEQALLARLRYNRLIDIFTGVTCYSMQNHLRSFVPTMGQVETDEIYVGLDRAGAHYVFPVQAKGGKDRISTVQVEQDILLCRNKFPELICRPLAAQFMADCIIALFEFEETDKGIRIHREKHYKLVPPEEVTDEDVKKYAKYISRDGE
jgi:hypothetical protein